MAEENKENMTEAQSQEAATAPPVDDRPNRKAFSERFAKRHKDIDFEDKEARYGAMNDDADALARYEEDGKALSEMFDNNRWLAAMAMDLKKNPDLNPIQWMASQGIDIGAAMQDEEMGKKVAQQIADFQQKKADEDSHEQELFSNLQKSADAMEQLGLDDDAKADLWEKFSRLSATLRMALSLPRHGNSSRTLKTTTPMLLRLARKVLCRDATRRFRTRSSVPRRTTFLLLSVPTVVLPPPKRRPVASGMA